VETTTSFAFAGTAGLEPTTMSFVFVFADSVCWFFAPLLGDWPGVRPPRRFPAAVSLVMSMVTVVSLPAAYVLRNVWICRLRCEFQ
jgi:hypothetical protein